MNVERIVSLEEAKKIKAEGFKRPTEFYYQDIELPYSPAGLKKMKNGKRLNHNKFHDFIYSAPTYSDFLKFKKI
jgi:hypothetical protein